VIAILAQAPGGLKLLPAADYNQGKPWLQLGDNGARIPFNGDPYKEIYLNTKWYGLVPEGNTELLDPSAPTAEAAAAREEEDGPTLSARSSFQINIEGVQFFHKDISGKCHAPSYVHYGDDAKQLSWGELHWSGGSMMSADGTVPASSGAAPKIDVLACFRQGSLGTGEYAKKGKKGYDHQGSYNDERTRWATLYAAVRLAQGADWA